MLRALLPGAAAAPLPAATLSAAAFSTATGGSALDWLARFVNHEQRGVPAAAGTDSDAGFDLVRVAGGTAEWCGKGTGDTRRQFLLMPALRWSKTPSSTYLFLDVNQVLQGRMRRLLADVGEPQTAWPAVHVAGTKGKGSTVAMLAAILQAAGYRAGAYTRQAGWRLGLGAAWHARLRHMLFPPLSNLPLGPLDHVSQPAARTSAACTSAWQLGARPSRPPSWTPWWHATLVLWRLQHSAMAAAPSATLRY